MARTIILGYGNPMREDDGAGMVAAERLRERFAGDPDVRVVAAQQLTPELAPELAEYDRAVFIDASAELKPGWVSLDEVKPAALDHALTHHLNPPALLAMARELYGNAPRAWLITVGGKYFSVGHDLSTPVARALVQCIDHAAQLVEQP